MHTNSLKGDQSAAYEYMSNLTLASLRQSRAPFTQASREGSGLHWWRLISHCHPVLTHQLGQVNSSKTSFSSEFQQASFQQDADICQLLLGPKVSPIYSTFINILLASEPVWGESCSEQQLLSVMFQHCLQAVCQSVSSCGDRHLSVMCGSTLVSHEWAWFTWHTS